MKQLLALAILIAVSNSISITHDHRHRHRHHWDDDEPLTNKFTFSIDYAAKNKFRFDTSGMAIYWNDHQIFEVMATDYDIHTFTTELQGKVGENVLNIAGTGTSDLFGMSIDNVRLVRKTPYGKEDLIVNGGFEEGINIPSGWRYVHNVIGWTSDQRGIQIGVGPFYNPRWPADTHVAELDSAGNVDIYQSIYLDENYRQIDPDSDSEFN